MQSDAQLLRDLISTASQSISPRKPGSLAPSAITVNCTTCCPADDQLEGAKGVDPLAIASRACL